MNILLISALIYPLIIERIVDRIGFLFKYT